MSVGLAYLVTAGYMVHTLDPKNNMDRGLSALAYSIDSTGLAVTDSGGFFGNDRPGVRSPDRELFICLYTHTHMETH